MDAIAHVQGPWSASVDLLGAAALVAVGATVAQPRRRIAALAAAALVVVATSPPVHGAADRTVTAHMVQHLVLVVVAAPLLAWGAGGSSIGARAGVRRAVARGVRPAWAPTVAALVHVGVMVAWHLPSLYDAAVDVPALHGLEHVTLTGSAVWWWLAAGHHLTRSNPLGAAASLVLVAGAGAGLGVVLMFAEVPVYASQRDVADLQVAGALLAASGAVYAATAVVAAARAVDRFDRPRPRRLTASRDGTTVGMLVAGGAFVLAALLPATRAASAEDVADVLGSGEALYERDCLWCHGVAGEGTARGIAIDDRGTASVFYALATGRMPLDEPEDRVERGEPHYPPEEIAALVAHTATFVDGPDVPPLEVAASLATGGQLYRLYCAACHSATGIGGGLSGERAAPSLRHADRPVTAAAVVAGPGGMPSFAFTDQEVAAVADYVEYLDDPRSTGVTVPGGRVGEGLVGLVVGLGGITAVAAWLARSR